MALILTVLVYSHSIDTAMNSISPIMLIILIIVTFIVQVFIIRWVLRVNDMIFYLDKINDKLRKICEEKGLLTQTELDNRV